MQKCSHCGQENNDRSASCATGAERHGGRVVLRSTRRKTPGLRIRDASSLPKKVTSR